MPPSTDSTSGTSTPQRSRRASRADAEDLVLTTITHHADALLRTARRHSLCADDANDAYQRGLEIFMRHAPRLDPARAANWLHTVIKHEAMAVRRSRQELVGAEEFDGDAHETRQAPAPEERLVAFEDLTRAAEALRGLKPQEVRALWLRMEGQTYKQIAATTGWTYTKVNRCVTEGRRAFLKRYAGIESGEECRRWEPLISAFADGEVREADAGDLRRHLRNCGGCRTTLRTLRAGDRSLQAVLPIGLALGASDGGQTVTNLFVRVYEAVAGGLHDRAVAVAAKAQLAVEATGAGKVAAVAGTAAAVAGGGAATVERVAREPARPTAEVASIVRPASPSPASSPARIRTGTRTATVAIATPASSPRRTRSAAPRASSTASRPARSRPSEHSPPPAEFGFEGGVSQTAAAAPSAPTRATTAVASEPSPAATAAPPRRTAPGRSSGRGEFDLEP